MENRAGLGDRMMERMGKMKQLQDEEREMINRKLREKADKDGRKLETCYFCKFYFLRRPCIRDICRQTCEECNSLPAMAYNPPMHLNQTYLTEKMKETGLCSTCAANELFRDSEYHKRIQQDFEDECEYACARRDQEGNIIPGDTIEVTDDLFEDEI